MKFLKKFIVILTFWAYALQAVAGVASPCQHPVGIHESVVSAGAAHADHDHVAPQALPSHEHQHLAGLPHSHHGDEATSDCDKCAQCDQGGCTCSDHSCSSSPGITSAGISGSDIGVGVTPVVISALEPLQAFRLGLIRPPSIS